MLIIRISIASKNLYKFSQNFYKMKVLKFGGSSVANSKNIEKVINIVANSSAEQSVVVVVSAFGKTTNALIKGATLAAQKNEEYLKILKELEDHHFKVVKDLIPIKRQTQVNSRIKQLFNQLETIYEGCFLLRELSPKTLAKVSSFGELLSSFIIAKAANENFDTVYKDSRELIVGSDNYNNAVVDFPATFKNCKEYFSNKLQKVTILPGFIARTIHGKTTTLGRGGSDFTASIISAALNASELQICTDVSGMFTANPSIVKQASVIDHISYH